MTGHHPGHETGPWLLPHLHSGQGRLPEFAHALRTMCEANGSLNSFRLSQEGVPQAGDILLVEADERYVGEALWEEALSIPL